MYLCKTCAKKSSPGLFDPGPKADIVRGDLGDFFDTLDGNLAELGDLIEKYQNPPFDGEEYIYLNFEKVYGYLAHAQKKPTIDGAYGWLKESRFVLQGLLTTSAGHSIDPKDKAFLTSFLIEISTLVTGMQQQFHFV